jgi:hypothetical protein
MTYHKAPLLIYGALILLVMVGGFKDIIKLK